MKSSIISSKTITGPVVLSSVSGCPENIAYTMPQMVAASIDSNAPWQIANNAKKRVCLFMCVQCVGCV